MGGPEVPWAAGRSDAADGSTSPPDGRLPDADKGSLGGTVAHLRAIFYRMGFDDRDIVALSGAHALGRCHPDASGYDGPWTPTPTTLNNGYYSLLLNVEWTPRAGLCIDGRDRRQNSRHSFSEEATKLE